MITRNAIIISCPGRGKKYLAGAVKDLENMSNYLMSPRGGAWRKDEIYSLYNPTWPAANILLSQCTSDYQFIYFAGHGCSGEHRKRYLSFRDQDIEDTRLLTHNAKQLIIADACRVYYAAISGIPPAEDVLSSFTGDTDARKVFDDCIARSDDGKIIIHATQHNAEAKEERYGRGGAFTLSLLYTCLNFKTGMDLCPVMLTDLLPTVSQTLLSQKYIQTPDVPWKTGNLRVPFLIDTDQLVLEEKSVKNDYVNVEPENKPSLLKAIVVTTLLILLIRGLSN